MLTDDKTQYGPVFAALLREPRLAPLGPGTPNAAAGPLLRETTLPQAFAHTRVVDPEPARCCLAGIWLYHDYLDESHTICQDIETPDGSYWHAIMHRREPDFSNSKYWYRRVGLHPVFEPLRIAANELAADVKNAPTWIVKQSAWDPFAFADLCESSSTGNTELTLLCRKIAQGEWELLFDYCYYEGISGTGAT